MSEDPPIEQSSLPHIRQDANIPSLSIVSPVYLAEECLAELCHRITKTVSSLVDTFEIILVEDGSTDQSWKKILDLAKTNPHIRGLRLSRNFGQHQAISAGLAAAKGERVVILDCDLQNPPEEIAQLYTTALQGYDIVLSRRKSRIDSFISMYGSKLYYFMVSFLSGQKRDPEIGAFCILSRPVITEYLRFEEQSRTLLDVLYFLGFDHHVIDLPNPAREVGSSSYTFLKKCNAAINELITHTSRVIYIAVAFSFCISAASALSLFCILVHGIFVGFGVPGWASIVAVILFIGGFLGVMLGLVGIYIAKVYDEVRKRPPYVIREEIQFPSETSNEEAVA